MDDALLAKQPYLEESEEDVVEDETEPEEPAEENLPRRSLLRRNPLRNTRRARRGAPQELAEEDTAPDKYAAAESARRLCSTRADCDKGPECRPQMTRTEILLISIALKLSAHIGALSTSPTHSTATKSTSIS